MLFRTLIVVLACSAIAACSYTGSPQHHADGSDVGGTGDTRYDHQDLGGNKHLLTVTAAPGMMETEGSIAQRIHVFAVKFAANTCANGFDFVHDPNFDQAIAGGFMKRTKSYVFQCKG